MKKTKEVLVKGIGLSLLPAICTYLGRSDNIVDFLQDNGYLGQRFNIDLFRNCMSIMSIALTFIFLTAPLIISELESKQCKTQRDLLIKSNKEIFETTLKNKLQLEHCKLNVRIFVPKVTLWHIICKKIGISDGLEYHIKNVEGLAENDMTKNLKFKVWPQSSKQGLVGDCYNQRAVLYDDNLESSNETAYNLTEYQIAKTNNLKFILVCPIFSEGGDIVSIVSIDSNDKIKVRHESKEMLRKLVLNYTQSLYECIPDFFKPKGGII